MDTNNIFLICNDLLTKFKSMNNGYLDLNIHSLFKNSINLTVDDKSNYNNTINKSTILSILKNTQGLSPMSISMVHINTESQVNLYSNCLIYKQNNKQNNYLKENLCNKQNCVLKDIEQEQNNADKIIYTDKYIKKLANIDFTTVHIVNLEKNGPYINLLLQFDDCYYINFKINLNLQTIEFKDKKYNLVSYDLSIEKKKLEYLDNKTLRKNFITNLCLCLQDYLDKHCDDFCIYKIYKYKNDVYICDILDEIILHKNYSKLDELLGLGNGLTPAGDDFILGVICFYYFFNNYVSVDTLNTISLSLDKIKASLHKTNDISSNMLSLGFKKLYHSSIIELLDLISDYKDKPNFEIYTKLNKIPSYGHSSYYDFLCGFYYSLRLFPFN